MSTANYRIADAILRMCSKLNSKAAFTILKLNEDVLERKPGELLEESVALHYLSTKLRQRSSEGLDVDRCFTYNSLAAPMYAQLGLRNLAIECYTTAGLMARGMALPEVALSCFAKGKEVYLPGDNSDGLDFLEYQKNKALTELLSDSQKKLQDSLDSLKVIAV